VEPIEDTLGRASVSDKLIIELTNCRRIAESSDYESISAITNTEKAVLRLRRIQDATSRANIELRAKNNKLSKEMEELRKVKDSPIRDEMLAQLTAENLSLRMKNDDLRNEARSLRRILEEVANVVTRKHTPDHLRGL
jgi:alanyl-tRNA synthetase